jgi:hypothetical protein
MALVAQFQPGPGFGDNTNLWHNFQFPNHLPFISDINQDSAIGDSRIFSGLSEPASPLLASQRPMPEFVQPQDLVSQNANVSTSSPTSHASPPRRSLSIDSTSSSLAPNQQQLLRRMSLAAIDLQDDSYRPRNTPARRKKAATGRIKPRSDKHARELELNRKAATKCRNRQKAFVEQLQKKCKQEEEKMHIQSALVSALHDEVTVLRNEIMRQSFCECRFLSRAPQTMLQ